MPFIPLLIGFTVASSEATLPTYLAYLAGSLGLMSAGGVINEFTRRAPAAEESDDETPDEITSRAAREAIDNMAKEKAAATRAVLRETARSVQPIIRQADAIQARLSAEASQFEAQNATMQREVERLTHEIDTLNQANQSANTMIASLSRELDALKAHSSSVYDNLTTATEGLRLGEVALSGTRRQLNTLETALSASEAHYQEEIRGLGAVLENIEQAPNQAEQIQRLQQQLISTTAQHEEAVRTVHTYAEALHSARAQLNTQQHNTEGDISHEAQDSTDIQLSL
ncbi:MAG: hypothetical protein K0U24_03550 [Gammaproteobacteria bacterium]|nr:hypothetical protein [Gammaproteobacteria bacterium]